MADDNDNDNDDEKGRKRSRDDDDDDDVHKLLSLRKPPVDPQQDLTTLTKLDLPGCQLSTLPFGLPDALPNLSILFLSNNDFAEVPPVIGACKKLQMVAFKANKLTSIHPDALQSQMRWLILTDNQLTAIPETIGRCTRLQKCMLSGNLLTALPGAISQCQNLELIRLSSNKLTEPPMKLLELPNLSWVALSNSPFLQNVKLATATLEKKLPTIDISEEQQQAGEVLGKGAGGITRKVLYNDKPVAVKTFVGAMTSDGSPEAERQMSLTISSKITNNPYLIQLLGETPDGSLVMEYLDNYQALAGPPSLETCSRDVYSCDQGYMTERQCYQMVSGLLDLLDKMHSHGIIHGDFYAHNILVSADDRSKVRLSDFGAAFFYDPQTDYGKRLQRTELRAFGHFVNEVQELFVGQDKNKELLDLVAACRGGAASFAQVNKQWKEAVGAGTA